MKTYQKQHMDTRYGTFLSFQLKDNQVDDPFFVWEENNEEFRYKGELYDVVALQRSASNIRICATKDSRENDLEKQVAEIHHDKDAGSSDGSISFIKFFSAFCISHNVLSLFSPTGSLSYGPAYDTDLLADNHEVSSPPPRF